MLSREYDNIGCAAGLFLLVAVLIGLFVTVRAAGIAAICMQLGPDAYFKHGVDYVPHKQPLLNNGQRIAPIFQFVQTLIYFVLMPIWVFIALLIAIGLNKLIEYRNRRLRSKAARKPRHS